MRRLDAAALVDRDVDDDRAGLHLGEHLAADELRRARARDEHGADDDVGMRDRLLDLEARRHEQADPAGEDLVEVPHPVDRALENRDLRAEPERDDRGVVADDPAAEDDDATGLYARSPREENAAAAERLLEEVRRGLRREPSRDLAHRGEQRQAAVLGLDRLVRDRGDSAVRERARQRLVGGDVEVREEHEPLAKAEYSGSIGSLTLRRRSASAQTASTEPIFAPARS